VLLLIHPAVVVAAWTRIALSAFWLVGIVLRVVYVGFVVRVEGRNRNTLHLVCIIASLLPETEEPYGFKDSSPGRIELWVSYKNLEQL
jgi:hypothetical protein